MAISLKDCINKTDENLVILTLKNQEYYLCLMKRYEGELLNYIMKISNVNKHDAEDILQESFIKAYQNLNDFDSNFKFSNWIFRITHNTTISTFRKNKMSFQMISWEEKELNDLLKSSVNIESGHLQKSMHAQILKTINNLPLKYKEVLVLKFIEEKDYRAISDILQKPMGTIATLVNRAKKALNRELKNEGVDF